MFRLKEQKVHSLFYPYVLIKAALRCVSFVMHQC